MQIRENGVYIEAIKLAAGSVQYKDISVKDTFILFFSCINTIKTQKILSI